MYSSIPSSSHSANPAATRALGAVLMARGVEGGIGGGAKQSDSGSKLSPATIPIPCALISGGVPNFVAESLNEARLDYATGTSAAPPFSFAAYRSITEVRRTTILRVAVGGSDLGLIGVSWHGRHGW